MDSHPQDFPFGIMTVVELLHLSVRRRLADSVYVDCPFCGDKRGKMNVNFVLLSGCLDEFATGTPAPFMRRSFPFDVPSGTLIVTFLPSKDVIEISQPSAACDIDIGTAQ